MVKIDLTEEGLAKGNFLALKADDKLEAARTLLSAGKLGAARDKVSEALLAAPKRSDILATFADVADRLGRPRTATAIAETAVEFNPDEVFAHRLLAQKRLRSGRVTEAIESLRNACVCNPDHVASRLQLADTLWDQNQLPEAVTAYQQAALSCGIDMPSALHVAARMSEAGMPDLAQATLSALRAVHPDSVRLCVLHAESCLAGGLPAEALTISGEVAHGGPNTTELRCVRARAQIDLGQPAAALRTLAHLPTEGDRGADVALLRAVACRFTGQFVEAKRAYETVFAFGYAPTRAVLGYAVVLDALGLPGEAVRQLDRIACGSDVDASVLHERTRLLAKLGDKAGAREARRHAVLTGTVSGDCLEGPAVLELDMVPELDVAGCQELLVKGALARDEAIGYLFGLGHALVARGEPGQAMEAWTLANQAVRDRLSFDVDSFTQWLRRITDVCAGWSAPLCTDPPANQRLIFVTGMPRSGTTLVEHVLAAHPTVHSAGEGDTVNTLLRDLGACFPDLAYPDLLHHLDADALRDLRRHLLDKLARSYPGASVIVDKMPGNFAHLSLLRRLLPEAVFLDCRRDSRDVGLSIFTQWFRDGHQYAYDLTEIGRVQRAYADVMAAWRAELPAEALPTVEYEALAADPSRGIAAILDAVGLSHAPACFEPWRQTRHVESGSALRVARPITAARIGRWRVHQEALKPLLFELGADRPDAGAA